MDHTSPLVEKYSISSDIISQHKNIFGGPRCVSFITLGDIVPRYLDDPLLSLEHVGQKQRPNYFAILNA